MPRGNGDGDRPPLLDHRILGAGDDQQMAVRRFLEDVLALVQQIGADPAALLRPALGQVAIEQRRALARLSLSGFFTRHRHCSDLDD